MSGAGQTAAAGAPAAPSGGEATRPVLLSAGGTGGHLFPAAALAHELRARGHAVHLVTDARASRFAEDFPADAVHVVVSATLGGRNPVRLAAALWTLFRGTRAAGRLIRAIRPKAVVGFGGYPTIPPLLAATNAGLPTMLHEQNAVMGRANRALAGRVRAIAGGFLEPAGPHADKIVTTGNPVRPAVLEAAGQAYQPSAGEAPFRLVVFGGSQGARFFSECVPDAIQQLPEAARRRLRLTQQARGEDVSAVEAAYAAVGIEAEIAPFFPDLAARLGAAHLVVSRSGASTVSEIAAIGRPAILVPYPHALDHDQAANAAALKARGGAEVIAQSELDSERLAGLIVAAMDEPDRLAETAERARAAGNPRAARLLADMVEAIAEQRPVAELKEHSA